MKLSLKKILLISFILIVNAFALNLYFNFDSVIDSEIDHISSGVTILPQGYRLNIVDVKYFDVNYITLKNEEVVDMNILEIGWNGEYICFVYDDLESNKHGFGYINLKNRKITKINSETEIVTIPEEFSKLKYYTPKQLYLQKEKRRRKWF